MNWKLLKQEIETLVRTFPQRAARAKHAISQIEAGLAELAAVGYSYEPVLKETLAAIEDTAEQVPATDGTLSVDKAMEQVSGQPSMVVSESSAVHQSN